MCFIANVCMMGLSLAQEDLHLVHRPEVIAASMQCISSTLLTQGVHTAQVKNAAGQWVAADPIPGTLVCNIGDMLRVWTHGLYQVRCAVSEPHQARASPSSSSCVTFSGLQAQHPWFLAVLPPLEGRGHRCRYDCKRMHSSMVGRCLDSREPVSTNV